MEQGATPRDAAACRKARQGRIHPIQVQRASLAVLKTSHYDVSKGGGDFKLPNLPPERYTITAWREDYGAQTAEVTITGDESKEFNFIFKVKAY